MPAPKKDTPYRPRQGGSYVVDKPGATPRLVTRTRPAPRRDDPPAPKPAPAPTPAAPAAPEAKPKES